VIAFNILKQILDMNGHTVIIFDGLIIKYLPRLLSHPTPEKLLRFTPISSGNFGFESGFLD
jgi:hypothetical protein